MDKFHIYYADQSHYIWFMVILIPALRATDRKIKSSRSFSTHNEFEISLDYTKPRNLSFKERFHLHEIVGQENLPVVQVIQLAADWDRERSQ